MEKIASAPIDLDQEESGIIALNKLILDRSGIWIPEEYKESIAYSDGDREENYLDKVIEQAKDLSSCSTELEEKIIDWSSEYHLSSMRANIFRALDLADVNSVLELGCGCGAISRYLGDIGKSVDAIEGNNRRATIAAKRCRDLKNVNIINANFNDLIIPKGEYDLVAFVGVLEYAKRFKPEADSTWDAVKELLVQAKSSIKDDGLVIVAIENRLGLKYLLGASEDHIGKGYVGIYGYSEENGIRTYSYQEWDKIFQSVGFNASQTYLPFPDYKVARAVISGNYSTTAAYSGSILSSISSRDYLKGFDPGANEKAMWKGISQANVLSDLSNSFVFVLGKNEQAVNRATKYEFSYFSDLGRRPEYRVVTTKEKGNTDVIKSLVNNSSQRDPRDTEIISTQSLATTEYIEGILLEDEWVRIAIESNEAKDFLNATNEYYQFLVRQSNEDLKFKLIDVLPSNIIVRGGHFKIIDVEWILKERIEPETVLFRALFYFSQRNRSILNHFFSNNNIENIEAFIKWVFASLGLKSETYYKRFLEMEKKFQRDTQLVHRTEELDNLLSLNLVQSRSDVVFHPKVYWSRKGEKLNETNTIFETAVRGEEHQLVRLKIPVPITELTSIRFDPVEDSGYLHIHSLKIFSVRNDGQEREVWNYFKDDTPEKSRARLVNIEFQNTKIGATFISKHGDPQFIIDTKGIAQGGKLQDEASVILESSLDWPRSTDYIIARTTFLKEEKALKTELSRLEKENTRLRLSEEELEIIRSSRVWRVAEKLRKGVYFGLLKRVPVIQKISLQISKRGLRGTIQYLRNKRHEKGRNWFTEEVKQAKIDGVPRHVSLYRRFIEKDIEKQASDTSIEERLLRLKYRPKISVVLPVYNTIPEHLEKAIESVRKQSYENWELCIADDNSNVEETKQVLRKIVDPKIKIRMLQKNKNISGATNEAISMTQGEYVGLLDHDDELTSDALLCVVEKLNQHKYDVIYSDEDFIDLDGTLLNPHFKPDYSPDLLLSHNYITHFLIVNRALIGELGGFKSAFDGAQDYDFLLRLTEKTTDIGHIRRVLYHWRKSKTSTSYDEEAKPGAIERSGMAITEATKRRNIDADVVNANMKHFFRVKRNINSLVSGKVSIVIPFRDRPDLLVKCLNAIVSRTNYTNYEIIGVSNNSESTETFEVMEKFAEKYERIRFIERNVPFNFSELVNYGADASSGRHLMLLNNDIEVINYDWMDSLLEHSERDEVGAVGGKLYFPNNRVQHAGIILGIGGYAGHSHKGFAANKPGYFNRLNLIQNVSAVTGAFLMVKKSLWKEVGGFDEVNLKIACNDVDFCLRLSEAGKRTIYTPYAEAYHAESSSRGYEDTDSKKARFEKEKEYFFKRHADLLERGDPYYNPNLSHSREDFSLNI